MQTKDLVSTLKKFDAYPKTLEDFRVKTFGGAAGKLKLTLLVDIVALMRFCFIVTNLIYSVVNVQKTRSVIWLEYDDPLKITCSVKVNYLSFVERLRRSLLCYCVNVARFSGKF